MTALLILMTPILLLAIVGLFAFVGCTQTQVVLAVTPQVYTADSGTSSIVANLGSLSGGELLVAAVQWDGASQPTIATDSGAVLTPAQAVNNGNAFAWNGMKIQVFSGVNPSQTNAVKVLAVLSAPSSVTWSLCIFQYATKTPTLYGAVSSAPNAMGTEIAASAPVNVMNAGDAVYAVAYAADGNGNFPGNNQLSAGLGFTAAASNVANPLLETLFTTSSGMVIAQATNRTGLSNSGGFIVAVAVQIS